MYSTETSNNWPYFVVMNLVMVDKTGKTIGASIPATVDDYAESGQVINNPDLNEYAAVIQKCVGYQQNGLGIDCHIFSRRWGYDGTPKSDIIRVDNDQSVSPYYPSLAWTGKDYRFFWSDRRDWADPDVYYYSGEIYSAAMGADGIKNSDDKRLTFTTGYANWPMAISGSSEIALVWGDTAKVPGLFMSLIYFDGGLKTVPIDICETGQISCYSQGPVWTGTDYALTAMSLQNNINYADFKMFAPNGQKTNVLKIAEIQEGMFDSIDLGYAGEGRFATSYVTRTGPDDTGSLNFATIGCLEE